MLPKKATIKRPKSTEQALSSLMRLCARAERSSGDALRLMARWEVAQEQRQEVLQRLIKERFIDDNRYAEAFVREKVNLGGWGEYKIRTALRRKGINEQIIIEAIKQIPTEKSAEQLQQKLERKIKSIKYENAFQLRNKLMRYALSLGYPMQSVIERVEELMQNINIKEECDDIFF